MPDNVSTQFKETGNISFRASAAVTGKRFLKVSGNRTGGPGLSTDLENLVVCAQAGAGQVVVGVSKYDVAIDESGGMHGQPGMIVPVNCGADITAGAKVMSDANGRAIPWVTAASEANEPAGIAMTGCDITVAGDADAMIKLI